ncbi:YugE family protein [Staphylococcus simulans]|uniref:DUF1871 family protein n=1 Tax=Staphylococcus simulans TaxID=1286 RepID=UPI001E5221DA|nr:DUF1871 family protein [Staphylococcus simulans]MCD8914326.1 YugE family protein [Staphylococcus simulans]
MEKNEVNIALYQLLADWNPMQFQDKTMGDAEVYEMMDAVHQAEDVDELAQKFQDIFVFSFEERLPIKACKQKADEALSLEGTCGL